MIILASEVILVWGLKAKKEMESSRGERGKNKNEGRVVNTEENMKRRKYVKSLYI
jgi:hypothetical protein